MNVPLSIVVKVKGRGSSAFEFYVAEFIMTLSRVSITLFENVMISAIMIERDTIPPKRVLYSGYYLTLSN